ncbi:MAG: hypothetical protein ACFCVE_02210 [Phycisphaerae bacterium]
MQTARFWKLLVLLPSASLSVGGLSVGGLSVAGGLLAGVCVIAGGANLVQAAQLSDGQKRVLDEAVQRLDAVEAKVAAVEAALPSATRPQAGDFVRELNNATREMRLINIRLGSLPGGDASAQAAVARYNALVARVSAAGEAARALPDTAPANPAAPATPTTPATPKPPSTPATPAAPASPAQPGEPAARLGYQQVEALKGAQFNLRQAAPQAQKALEIAEAGITADSIRQIKPLLEDAARKLQFARDQLAALPAGHPDVAAAVAEADATAATINRTVNLANAGAGQAAADEAALQQAYAADADKLQTWWRSLGNPQFLFDELPDDFIAMVKQLEPVKQELATMEARWGGWVAQNPNEANRRQMATWLRGISGRIEQFEAFVEAQRVALPERIAQDVTNVERLVRTGIEEKRPLFFGADGGIAQQMGFARHRQALLSAIDPAAGEATGTQLDALAARIDEAKATLRDDIIRNNPWPSAQYRGPDVEQLRVIAKEKWLKDNPETQVLDVVFETAGWVRTTRWDWSEGNQGFGKVDYSKIQATAMVKHDDVHAASYPIDIYKNHMAEDRVHATPWEIEEDPLPNQLVLLEKQR